jgi:hypothetical protein
MRFAKSQSQSAVADDVKRIKSAGFSRTPPRVGGADARYHKAALVFFRHRVVELEDVALLAFEFGLFESDYPRRVK